METQEVEYFKEAEEVNGYQMLFRIKWTEERKMLIEFNNPYVTGL